MGTENSPKPTVIVVCLGRLGFEIFLGLAVFVGAEHCSRGKTSVLELLLVYLDIWQVSSEIAQFLAIMHQTLDYATGFASFQLMPLGSLAGSLSLAMPCKGLNVFFINV